MISMKTKLVIAFIKQIAKPVAISLSELAKQNAQFRSLSVRMAQRYNQIEFTSKGKIFGFGKPLSEDQAINLGTRLIGETFLYGVSATILLYEYNMSARNEQIKEKMRKFEIGTLQRQIYEYGMTTEQQETEIKELKRKMVDLENSHMSLANKLFSSLYSQ